MFLAIATWSKPCWTPTKHSAHGSHVHLDVSMHSRDLFRHFTPLLLVLNCRPIHGCLFVYLTVCLSVSLFVCISTQICAINVFSPGKKVPIYKCLSSAVAVHAFPKGDSAPKIQSQQPPDGPVGTSYPSLLCWDVLLSKVDGTCHWSLHLYLS